MLIQKIVYLLLFLVFTTYSFADTNDEKRVKKALEGINQIKVVASSPPKIVSEIPIKIKVKRPKKEFKKTVKKNVVKKKIVKKPVKKTSKKIIKHPPKKKVIKKPIKKKIEKKEPMRQTEANNFPELNDVQTLGVVSQSKPYTLGN